MTVKWLEAARKPERRRAPGAPSPGSVNPVTRKPYPGVQYAVRTRRHNRAVACAFYEYHREAGTGPMVNPMPARRGRDGGRADAHHSPLEPFERGRRADFQPPLPRQEPRYLPDAAFDALFAALGSDRDRAIVAFYISTGARASEDILASLHARLAEAREQGWGGEIAGLEVSIAAAGQKLAATGQLAARHQVTHLGMPDFRPSTGRSSGAEGGP